MYNKMGDVPTAVKSKSLTGILQTIWNIAVKMVDPQAHRFQCTDRQQRQNSLLGCFKVLLYHEFKVLLYLSIKEEIKCSIQNICN